MDQLITLDDYWTGDGKVRRDEMFRRYLTHDIRANAQRWVEVANALANDLALYGIVLQMNPKTGTPLSSGWRPPTVNAGTPGASPTSGHMDGSAGDVYDPDGMIDEFLLTPDGIKLLEKHGVWIEHPSHTKTWSHWQTFPQRSYKVTGLRYFHI